MKILNPRLQSGPLVFSTQSYPTFGRERKLFDEGNPPQTVTASPYYWWFMFLRLNTNYKKFCQSKGRGTLGKLYKDLGDVTEVNFKDWWKEKAHYFAEPKKGYRMMIALNQEEIAPFNDDTVLNLVVPLTWSQRSLKKAFTSLVLSKVEKGRRGVSVEKSDAQYRLSGRWHIEALKTAYNVYAIKSKADAEGEKIYWADIGIQAKLPMSYAVAKESVGQNSDIRRTLTILTKRHYNRALLFIDAAASNSFPYKK
jgi:hypothetical protein